MNYDPKFSDRLVGANNVDPHQTTLSRQKVQILMRGAI